MAHLEFMKATLELEIAGSKLDNYGELETEFVTMVVRYHVKNMSFHNDHESDETGRKFFDSDGDEIARPGWLTSEQETDLEKRLVTCDESDYH